MTQIFHLDPLHIDAKAIQTAAVALREGQTVAFPTETVYGLGGNALDPQAVRRIFAAKGRPSDNPLIVHIVSKDALPTIVSSVPPIAERLMQHFWPGPLTMIFPRAKVIPDEVTAGLDTVAVRMPDHPVALALIAAAGIPVAAPSANRSGRPSPTRAEHVVEDLWDKVALILDAGPCAVGVESTVLDVTCDPPMILRPGGVTKEMLEEVIWRPITVDPAIGLPITSKGQRPKAKAGNEEAPSGLRGNQSLTADDDCRGAAENDILDTDDSDPQRALAFGLWPLGSAPLAPRSPGMKYTHYAPQAPMTLYVGSRDAVVRTIAERAAAEIDAGRKVGVMLTLPVAFMPGDVVIQLAQPTGFAEPLGPSPSTLAGDRRGAAVLRPGDSSSPSSPMPFASNPEPEARDQGLGIRDSAPQPTGCGSSCWLRRNPHLDWLKTNDTHDPDAYSPEDLQSIANGIYDALRRFDEAGVDLILAQGVPETGLGQAIMNRLTRAAGGNVVKC